MSMIPVMNPYGGADPLIDKMIGNAYHHVKLLYDNMASIVAIGESLSASVIGQPLFSQRSVEYVGAAGAKGATVIVEFDDEGIDISKILSSHPRITASNGSVYFGDSGTFTSHVQSDGLHFTLSGGAPDSLVNGTITWFIIYGG